MPFPIINYHLIFDDSQSNNEKHAVHIGDFERQMAYLAENGFESLTIPDLINPAQGREGTEGKLILITFDDGNYSDYHHVFPILKKYNFVATFFITTDWVSNEGYLSWENLKEMKEAGMSSQSHSESHRFLPDLSSSDLRKELRDSKKTIEDRLGSPVQFVSIPSGFVSGKVVEMARDEGYRGVCTSVPDLNHIIERSFLILNRFTITRNTSFDVFRRMVEGESEFILPLILKYKVKSVLRKLIGNRLYYRIWAMYSKQI